MNEYKIHQRFFAKLKEKAEKKKNEMEVQTKKEEKENIQKEKPKSSPERPPRKRHGPPPEEKPSVKEPEAVEQQGTNVEPNGVSYEAAPAPVITKDSESDKEIPEKTQAKKKIKISNGVDSGVNSSSSSRSNSMGNGCENCYDGGISLAQFLADALQSQDSEENQNSTQGEKPKEKDIPISSVTKEKDKEEETMEKEKEEQLEIQWEEDERQKRREEELAKEKTREREKQLAISLTVPYNKHGSEVKHHNKVHKDHDHHNIQASISSMLHTVKDFLFGKSKKDSHDQIENKEREFDLSPGSTQPPPPEMPPSFQLQQEYSQWCEPVTENTVPMEVDKSKEPSEFIDVENKAVPLEVHDHKLEDSVLHVDLPPTQKLPSEGIEASVGQSVKEAEDAVEYMEPFVGPEGPNKDMPLSGLQLLTEVCAVVLLNSWLLLGSYI